MPLKKPAPACPCALAATHREAARRRQEQPAADLEGWPEDGLNCSAHRLAWPSPWNAYTNEGIEDIDRRKAKLAGVRFVGRDEYLADAAAFLEREGGEDLEAPPWALLDGDRGQSLRILIEDDGTWPDLRMRDEHDEAGLSLLRAGASGDHVVVLPAARNGGRGYTWKSAALLLGFPSGAALRKFCSRQPSTSPFVRLLETKSRTKAGKGGRLRCELVDELASRISEGTIAERKGVQRRIQEARNARRFLSASDEEIAVNLGRARAML